MITRRTLLLGVGALGLGACGGDDKGDKDGPPKISYGSETCDRCNMVIGEERHAAALKGADGNWLLFDDTGEMIVTAQDAAPGEIKAWVHDYETSKWHDATAASYVWLPSRNTPMATGIVAYGDQALAEAKAQETGGWSKPWSAVLADWTMS
ncbi:MAG TPA: nitrous oxide reductase accessory protein NosL [Thermomicrobiales bacterium]|nr:nitrous oxide reductase accessory protein NosL [Thermomicrobiales bacterium]